LKSKYKNLNCPAKQRRGWRFLGILLLLCVYNLQAKMQDSKQYWKTKKPLRSGGRELEEASEKEEIRNIA
jgi:hypothetical protein